MAGKNGHGGTRPGAGRKTKAEELGFKKLLDECFTVADQKKVLRRLAKDSTDDDFHTRHESRKLLLAYAYGKPRESVDLTSGGEVLTATFQILTRNKE